MTQKVGKGAIQPSAITDNLPGTTKGDLIVHDGATNVRIAVGANDKVLMADSSAAEGVAWKDPASVGSVPVGAMLEWAGASGSVPSGWLLCDGSAVSRSTYADLFAAIGTAFGAGDGSTTFNLPDFRGRVAVGDCGGAGDHAITITTITPADDQIQIPANETLQTGMAVKYTRSGGTTDAAPLVSGNTYYVIEVDATHVKLATTRANAVAGTAIDITGAGDGTQKLTYELTARTTGTKGGEEEHALTAAELPSHTHSYTKPISSAAAVGGGGDGASTSPDQTGSIGSSTEHQNLPPYLGANKIVYAGV